MSTTRGTRAVTDIHWAEGYRECQRLMSGEPLAVREHYARLVEEQQQRWPFDHKVAKGLRGALAWLAEHHGD